MNRFQIYFKLAFKFKLRRYNQAVVPRVAKHVKHPFVPSLRTMRLVIGHVLAEKAAADLAVGPGGICFFFCPDSLCLIPQIQPNTLCFSPMMPNYAD
jgi:hypothetical protein